MPDAPSQISQRSSQRSSQPGASASSQPSVKTPAQSGSQRSLRSVAQSGGQSALRLAARLSQEIDGGVASAESAESGAQFTPVAVTVPEREENSAIMFAAPGRPASTLSMHELAHRLTAAQKALILVGGLVGSCLLMMILSFAFTRSVAQTATAFVELAARDPASAYGRTSPTYRSRVPLSGFATFVRHICIDRMRSVAWYSRQLGGRTAGVSGDLTLGDGTRVPIEVALERTDGDWQISDLLGPEEVGRARPVEGRILPSDRKLQELIEESVGSFVTAIKTSDFASYYAGLAQRGRRLTAATDLPRMYKHALGQPLDLLALRVRPPEMLVPPVLERDGTLRLRGRYLAQPLGLRFELRYVYEDTEWRLMTAKFDLEQPADAARPGDGNAPAAVPVRPPTPPPL